MCADCILVVRDMMGELNNMLYDMGTAPVTEETDGH